MKFYSYDYEGKLIGECEAELCQVTELKKLEQSSRPLREGEALIESVYLLPAYSTLIQPQLIEGHEAFFINGQWEYKEIVIPEPQPEPEPYEPTYAEKRAGEYPSPFEYLDGIVKSNNEETHEEGVAQIEKYIQDCLAVKAKYPKPSGV